MIESAPDSPSPESPAPIGALQAPLLHLFEDYARTRLSHTLPEEVSLLEFELMRKFPVQFLGADQLEPVVLRRTDTPDDLSVSLQFYLYADGQSDDVPFVPPEFVDAMKLMAARGIVVDEDDSNMLLLIARPDAAPKVYSCGLFTSIPNHMIKQHGIHFGDTESERLYQESRFPIANLSQQEVAAISGMVGQLGAYVIDYNLY